MKKITLISCLLLTFYGNIFAQKTVKYNVYLRSDAGTDTMWDGRIIRVYGIASRLSEAPHIPAKTLYCNEGDTLILKALSISQGDHHTVHLHGLDATTINDGDPATSFWLNHQQEANYAVYAAHAGTYLYHCHVADVLHVQMGMYGLIVVKPRDGSNTTWTGGTAFDRSYNWILSEIDPSWHDSIPVHDAVVDTVHIPPYIPKYFLINGKTETQLPVNDSTVIRGTSGQTIYLRVGSIGFFYERLIFPSWMHAHKIDSDGRPLDEPVQNDTIEIAPGERYGILLDAASNKLDNINVEFVNMNTDSIWSVQHVPVIITSSSVDDSYSSSGDLQIFPNPTESSVTFSFSKKENDQAIIQVTDILGKTVYSGNAILPLQLDIRSFPSGIYRASVKTKNRSFHASFTVYH